MERSSARLKIVTENAERIQETLGRPFAVENITYHASLAGEMTELEFLVRFLNECDCSLLLDVTNLWVNSENHKYDAGDFGMTAMTGRFQIAC